MDWEQGLQGVPQEGFETRESVPITVWDQGTESPKMGVLPVTMFN